MDIKKPKKSKNFIWIIVGIIFLYFLVSGIFDKPTFSFQIDETDEKINGEVLINGESIGFTKGGKISVPDYETLPEEITFKGTYQGNSFEFLYEFPIGYKEYSKIPFLVYQEDLDFIATDNFQNVEEMHFIEMPITYGLGVNLDIYEDKRIRWALNSIENETDGLISFKEVSENPDIYFYGSYESYEGEDENYDVVGLAWINDAVANKIKESVVIFYSSGGFWVGGGSGYSWGKCGDYPVTEVHEILHAFGFGHVYDNNRKIMYPLMTNTQTCAIKKIDDETISCLKHIYSNGEISGDCSQLNIYPYRLSEKETGEQESAEIEDFKWEKLPISYSVFDCEEKEISRIKYSTEKLENTMNKKFFNYQENITSDINFFCKKENKELLTFETDYWNNGYPAINKYYYFEGEKIKQVNISLFGYEDCMNGLSKNAYLEMLAILRAIGLRNNYGSSMHPPEKINDYGYFTGCITSNNLGSLTTDKIKELYN